jgi:uncharacterized protein YodC (DUF2158 family)
MSHTPTYTIGTIVKLKSGGPDMTVKEVLADFGTRQPSGSYKCQWFAGKKLEDGIFPGDSLSIVAPENPSK